MLRLLALALVALLAVKAMAAVEWRNLDDAHRLGGRKVSEGYLQGKVVLVVQWGAESREARELLGRAEQVWRNFKTKPFVLLGSLKHDLDQLSQARSAVAEASATFPVYAHAALARVETPPSPDPLWYVVNPAGKVVYSGRREHNAVQAVVVALTDWDSPRNETQFGRFLDFEMENLPAHAYLRLKRLREKESQRAGLYDRQWRELDGNTEVKKVARIVEVSRRLKDFAPKSAMDRKRYPGKVKEALQRLSDIRDIADPRLVREAKNSIADLKWLEASL